MERFSLSVDLSDLQSRLHPLLHTISTSSLLQNIKPSTTVDGLAVLSFLLTLLVYLTRGWIWDKADPHYNVYFERPQVVDSASIGKTTTTRNISRRLEEGGYECVIFWGSQSGTAERFAETLSRECYLHFGINALVADLSEYDAESIARVQPNHFVIFLLSTYGEGDPSDNTSGLWEWIKQIRDKGREIGGLRYLAFGLGNSNYKHYNRVLDVVADALDAASASALMPRQKGDDANGATEEDFQTWKDDVFALFRSLGYGEQEVAYQPTVTVDFTGQELQGETDIMTSLHHQQSTTNSAIVPLVIKKAHELFSRGDRNCMHLELDLGNSDIVYKTGDHIGIWPSNPGEEVDRLLDALGVQHRRQETLTITSLNRSLKLKAPSPTTLEIVIRNYLEICGPVARKTVLDLSQFAPTPAARATLLAFGQDRARYERFTAGTHITLARLMQFASPNKTWDSLPLSFVIENLLALQPRYYSISSSSVISPRRIAITALVVNKPLPGESPATIHGLTSNYLLSNSALASNADVPLPTYQRISTDAHGTVPGTRILAHIRKSKFKLPITSSTPLILISAGTGFAPFRAFLQERAKLHALGKPVGKIILFFGCRNHNDFIYRDEIEKNQLQLGDNLEVLTAFSRAQGERKVYVQERVEECAERVIEALDQGANMYICGKASMAREVDGRLEDAAGKWKGLADGEVKAWVEGLKKRGKWKADVWG
ncbi:hypothetical protein N0V83_004877 [Neocucurbitaria cava]|uniref:NADPH--cytochrome P450 reductase n=1 Tax=Neocucurbitaria cava TaxID=798079 RepID=A0A9W8Y8J8_9PLEO|nr:hypothetical protein N0V83_004877 [Neocucurbitaria cava]